MKKFIIWSFETLAWISLVLGVIACIAYLSDSYCNTGAGFIMLGSGVGGFLLFMTNAIIIEAASIYIDKNKEKKETEE